MKVTVTPTHTVQIYIAGNRTDAERICRDFCFMAGLCVTLANADYIYTGGMESGVVVGLINYPRFPREPAEIDAQAEQLGHQLMSGLLQQSFCVVNKDETKWFSRRPE
jgi:hypothetical protein